MELIDFIPIKEINLLIEKSDIIITHGGVGSIINSIKFGKKVIAVPRLSMFNEHVNDHQVQIVESFDSSGLIKGVFDIDNLQNAIMNIDKFVPKPYVSNNVGILNIISNYIENN